MNGTQKAPRSQAVMLVAGIVVGMLAGAGALSLRDSRGAREDFAGAGAMPERFGVGAAPTPGLLAAWDSDIGADGAELPAGQGTVAQGAEIYRTQCANCHGANGEGVPPFPQLIGRPAAAENFGFAEDGKLPKTIGNYWPHATTVFDYVKRAMPLMTPGSLSDDETYAVTAYLLAANGVIADTATLNATALRAVRMPALDRFVPDDRAGSRVVR